MRAASRSSVVPPGATSLRLMVELLGARTLRSALAPPTDEGLRALRVAASVAADGGGHAGDIGEVYGRCTGDVREMYGR